MTALTRIGNIFYMVEMLLAATIFLYSAEKKRHFIWRYLGAMAFHVVFAWFFPLVSGVVGHNLFLLFRSVIQLGVTIVCAGFVFELPLSARLSSCVAGYAVQHITYNIVTLISHSTLLQEMGVSGMERHMLLELIFFPVIYLLFALTLGPYAAKNQVYKKVDIRFILLSFATVFICTGLRRISGWVGEMDTITACIYSIACCALALVVQFVLFRTMQLKHENEIINLLWQEDRKQYEISKRSIDLVNIKCHDLKYLLNALNQNGPNGEAESLEKILHTYDSRIKTGNEALDVLLTESNLRVEQEGITLNYSGNGADLSFMNMMDVYSLFGNALSNAVEAVRKLENPAKKLINIAIERKGDMIVINISNYFDGNIVFQDSIPTTSKTEEQGYHGFGIKSMRLIVGKYDGELKASVLDDIFNLSIYLMAS